MWIDRKSQPVLARAARDRPVVVLTGARQTGKTSLVRRTFPSHHYVTLDLPSEAEQAESDPARFLARHPPPLVIDEVQYAPGVLRHLKAVVDADRDRNGQFVLTGSQKITLLRGVAESLAGRVEVIELEGLSVGELREAGVDASPDELLVRGSMPELWAKPQLDAVAFYRSYVTTYLERDLRLMLAVGSLRDFERFLRACALRSAQLLNRADLARDVGISPTTAAAWLSALEASNQVFLLEPWFGNRGKALVKAPKLHVSDTGLLCFLLGLRSVSDFGDSPLAGAVWETFVCAEVRKQIRLGVRDGDIHFWRDRAREVDVLVHRGGRFDLYDAKLTEHPDAHDAAAMRRVAAELPDGSVARRAIVCRAPNAYPLGDGVEAIPIDDV